MLRPSLLRHHLFQLYTTLSLAPYPRQHVSRKHHPLCLRFRPRYPRSRSRLRIRTVCQQRRLSLLVVLPTHFDRTRRASTATLARPPYLSRTSPLPSRNAPVPSFQCSSFVPSHSIERKCATAESMLALSYSAHHIARCPRTTLGQASQDTESNE